MAESLLREGYAVALTGRGEQGVEDAAAALSQGFEGKVLGLVADVRNQASLKKAVAATVEAFGGVDVVIANAGVGVFKNISELTAEDWNDTLDTNLTGVFYTVKATLNEVIRRKGYIITIASLAGTNFFEKGTAYNASKFGLVGFTQALMLDVRDKDVKVSTIMPGSVATWFNNHVPSDADAWKIQPEDIGQMVADLLKMNPRTLPSKIEVRPSRVGK